VQNCEIGFQSGHVRDQSVICLNFGELDEGKGNKSIEHDRDGFEVHPSTVRKEGPASLTNIMTEHDFTRFCKDSSGDSTENNEFLLRNMGQSKRSVCDSPSTAHHLMSTPKKRGNKASSISNRTSKSAFEEERRAKKLQLTRDRESKRTSERQNSNEQR